MNEILKTSDEWQKDMLEVLVYDPDGWDRRNFKFSWFKEKIAKDEYLRRRAQSTCANKNIGKCK